MARLISKNLSFIKFLLLTILTQPFHTFACLPHEIHIRAQWIATYTKEDGTLVSAHPRSEHCRELKSQNYFQDSSPTKFNNLQTKFKSWKKSEKELINKDIEKLPLWIKRYKIANFLRASVHEGNPKNPALTYPASKTIIFFDAYFTSPNVEYVLLNEISHIAVWDVDALDLKEFLESNGWSYKNGKAPQPPLKVIIPDSSQSPSEDFANSVETYYSNPKRLQEFNPKSFEILDKIIKSKEKR